MKIIFLNPQGNFDSKDSYWTEHQDFGGQLVYVKEIALAMSKLGVEVDIITRKFHDTEIQGFDKTFDSYGDNENIRIIRIPCGPDKFLRKELLWPHMEEWCDNIASFYEGEGKFPDFITGHYGDGGIAAVMLSKKWDKPFSFTAHSLGIFKKEKLLRTGESEEKLEEYFHFSQRIAAENLAIKYASKIFVSSSMEKSEQYAHNVYSNAVGNSSDKIKIVPPGANRNIFNELKSPDDEKTSERIEGDKPLIIMASRIDDKKNHIAALKAFANCEKLNKNSKVLIVIRYDNDLYKSLDGIPHNERKVMEKWLELIREKNMENEVIFYKSSSQKQLASLYRKACDLKSVFCLPTLYEPFGLTVIEAMSCGLPVAGTKNGGPSDILSENGIAYGELFDPEKPESIAESLEKIIFSDDYEKISQNSIQRVIDKYTWDRTAEGYLKAIEEAIENYEKQDIKLDIFYLNLK